MVLGFEKWKASTTRHEVPKIGYLIRTKDILCFILKGSHTSISSRPFAYTASSYGLELFFIVSIGTESARC